MKKKNSIGLGLILLSVVLTLASCSKGTPYFSGANGFKQDRIAPEGIRVTGKVWYHNTMDEEGDHMSESLQVFMEGQEPLPVNYGRDHVIRIGGGARYDVPVVFYIPMEYVADTPQERTLIANKDLNPSITFTLKGYGTVLVGSDRYDMPVNVTKTIKVWDDME